MIVQEWCVIDPKFDRPFFSSSPPPVTLERTPGMQVILFSYWAPDPITVDKDVKVDSRETARSIAAEVYKQQVKAFR